MHRAERHGDDGNIGAMTWAVEALARAESDRPLGVSHLGGDITVEAEPASRERIGDVRLVVAALAVPE
jgi:hypothetical protein